jgi:hypothetical protein
MSGTPHFETVDEMTEGESFATPIGNPKPKVKVPVSAPGRTKRSSKAAKEKRTSSLSPNPAKKRTSSLNPSSDKAGKMKKTKSKKKKKASADEDNWSISSDEENAKANDFKEFSQSLPGPPLAKKSTSTKKGLRDEALPRKSSSRTAVSNNGDTLTPVSKKKAFNRQGSRSSNVSSKSPSRGEESAPTPATANGNLKSPGQLKRRSRSPGSLPRRSHQREGSSKSPGPLGRKSYQREGSSRSPGPLGRKSVQGERPSRSPGPLGRTSVQREGSTRSPGPTSRSSHRRSVATPQSPMTRASISTSPLRSSGAGLSPQRRSTLRQPGGPPLTQSPRRAQSLMANSPGGLPMAPLTPGGGRRSLPASRSPGSLAASNRYSLSATRTPNSASRRSVLGGRRATLMSEEDLKKLEIGPLDGDVMKGAGSDGSSPGEEEEEVALVVRKPYPKTDEEWEEFDKPPKSLVLVWVVVMGELMFDMGTTMIAFRALGEASECCGYPVTVGPFPMLITAPFFLLVSSEIALLARAILLTVWPNMMKPINLSYLDSDVESDDEDEDEKKESTKDGSDLEEDGSDKMVEETNIEIDEENKEEGTGKKAEEINIEVSEEDKEESSSVNQDDDGFENEGLAKKEAKVDEDDDDDDDDDDEEKRLKKLRRRRLKRRFLKYCCCWLQWKARMLMHVLDFLVLLNPFFGCFIAWVLMYQSDKQDAFVVLGFEAGSLALHYVSVWLEGGIAGVGDFFMQGVLPLIPFTVAISLVLFYLKQGGVCYLVEERVFKFTGCEVCVDGYPPVDGICYLKDGTNYTFVATDFLDLESYNTVEDLVARTDQVSYCAEQNPTGPDTDFCFFDFEDGQLDGLVIDATEAPTSLPVLSSSKCGASVGPGTAWETDCRRLLWSPTQDESMFCFAFGGPGDPCHLNIVHDGVNEGRFKDPSACRLGIRPDGDYWSYGDVLYLWDDPSSYGFSFQWAANAWLAYSTTRWVDEMTLLRSRGLKVSTPLVTFENEAQVVSQLSEFFDACGSLCDDAESSAYVDILAVNVFCDPGTETCSAKVAAVTSFLQDLSLQYNNRPIHIAQWGVRDSTQAPELLSAMDSTPGFFTDGSTIERVYWYGGDSPDTTSLRIQARGSRLGLIWAQTCAGIGDVSSS